MVCCELFRERILLAVPPQHRLASVETVDLKELRQERLLLLREGHCFRDNALAACRRARITPNAIFESDQFASIFALVAAGAGVSLIPPCRPQAPKAARSCRFIRKISGASATRTFAASLGRPLKRLSSTGLSARCSSLDDLARLQTVPDLQSFANVTLTIRE